MNLSYLNYCVVSEIVGVMRLSTCLLMSTLSSTLLASVKSVLGMDNKTEKKLRN